MGECRGWGDEGVDVVEGSGDDGWQETAVLSRYQDGIASLCNHAKSPSVMSPKRLLNLHQLA